MSIEEIGEIERADESLLPSKAIDPTSRELTPIELKTHLASIPPIQEIEHPQPYDKTDPEKITEAPPVAEKVVDAARQVGIPNETKAEPNLTLEGIFAVIAYEKRGMKQLHATEETSKKSLGNINNLLDISSALSAVGDKDSLELSAESLALLAQLRKEGINLLDEGVTKLNKEQLIQLRSDAGARIEKLRTEVQQNFTKIQMIIQFMNSINDTGKRMASDEARGKKTMIDNQKVR